MRYFLNSSSFFALLSVMGVAAAEGSHDNAPSRLDERCSADRADFTAQNPLLLRPYCDGCLEDGDGTMTLNCGLGCEACDENNENCHSFSSSTVYGMNEDNQTVPLTTSECYSMDEQSVCREINYASHSSMTCRITVDDKPCNTCEVCNVDEAFFTADCTNLVPEAKIDLCTDDTIGLVSPFSVFSFHHSDVIPGECMGDRIDDSGAGSMSASWIGTILMAAGIMVTLEW